MVVRICEPVLATRTRWLPAMQRYGEVAAGSRVLVESRRCAATSGAMACCRSPYLWDSH